MLAIVSHWYNHTASDLHRTYPVGKRRKADHDIERHHFPQPGENVSGIISIEKITARWDWIIC